MLSEPDCWEPEDYRVLGRMLRLNPDYILPHKRSLATEREEYFGEIRHSSDLFLDPDIGIETGRRKVDKQHIRPPRSFRAFLMWALVAS